MALVRCPTCNKQFESAESPVMPFCSSRCRKIDLNRWLNEEIALPVEDTPEEDPGPQAENGNGRGH